MTKFTTTFASAAAALLLAGNAFAAGPAAGEGPLFLEAPVSTPATAVQRQDVRVSTLSQMPASGEFTARSQAAAQPSDQTRAEVRAETRDAIAHGFVVKSGEQS